MHEALSKFQEVERILRENEQLHRRVGYLEAQNHQLSEELQTAALRLEWIATIARERPSRP
jgi:cell division protein FtsB